MAGTIVKEARLGGGMTTFTAGGGDEELAEVLTPELVPLRFRKIRMLVHEHGAIPGDGSCEETFVGHNSHVVVYAGWSVISTRDRWWGLFIYLSCATVSVCDGEEGGGH